MIKLRAQFLDYLIKTIYLNNAGEFTSQTFIDYYMSVGINIKHPIAHRSLVVQYMYQLHLHNALKWVPNEDLGFM